MANTNLFNMEQIMGASFGEPSNKLSVSFKKTVLVTDYETEVVEASSYIDLDKPLNGIERMFVTSILQAQMEYTVYCTLCTKGFITATQLAERKGEIEAGVSAIKAKADSLLGPGVIDKYISYDSLNK